jgi:diacylglycerol kinase (ATP)
MSEQQALVTQLVEDRGPPKFPRVHIIINPASGQDRPVLAILNDVFHPSGIDWDVSVTKEAGDGRRYALAALESGVDAIGVYGGDGTVNEVASALVGAETPLAIFPGGTANVMSVELGIPNDLLEACALVARGAGVVRAIDVGDTGEHIFLTRIGMGLEATVIQQTEREQKDRHGWLAYALNGLRQLVDPKLSHYRLTIDGETIESHGLVCMVANSGILSPNSGLPGKPVISFSPTISVTDGLLDILVVRSADIGYLLSVAANMVAGAETAQPLLHWTGREVSVVADPPQSIQYDGEVIGYTPVTAWVRPQALRVIVPANAAPPTGTPAAHQPVAEPVQ